MTDQGVYTPRRLLTSAARATLVFSAGQLARKWFRVAAAFTDKLVQRRIQRVPPIRPIESTISVTPADDQLRRLKLG